MLIFLLYSSDAASFFFRDLETELLLVATHFIEKDKDLRLPKNLKVSDNVNDLFRPFTIHLW